MTSVYTDDFNRADNATDWGSNWTVRRGTLGIVSNEAYSPGSTTYPNASWVSAMSTDDMGSQVTVGTTNGSPTTAQDELVMLLGANSTGAHVQGFVENTGTWRVYTEGDWNYTGETQRANFTTGPTFTTGDVISFERLGDFYCFLKNGVQVVNAWWHDTGAVVTKGSSNRLIGCGINRQSATTAYRKVNAWGAYTPDPLVRMVASGNAATSASRSPAITFTGYLPKAGDIVAFWASSGAASALATAPSGWVLPTPAAGANPVTSDSHTQAFTYHVVTAGEETAVTTTYTATNLWNATQTGNVVGVVLRGADTSTVIDSMATTFDSANAATPHILVGLTGTNLSSSSLVLSAVAKDATGTYTTPSGLQLVASNNTNLAQSLFSYDTLTTANTNVSAVNVTPSAGDEYASITVAFLLAPQPVTGTIAAALKKATASLTGAMQPKGTVAASVKKVTASFTGAQTQSGTVAATLRKPTAALSGSSGSGTTGTIAAALKKVTASASGYMRPSGTIAATLKKPTAALSGYMRPSGTISAALKKVAALFTGPSNTISFVTRDSTTGYLMLNGSRFRFAGANNAHSTGFVETATGGYGATSDSEGYHLANHAETDATLDAWEALNLNVMRCYLNAVGTVGRVSGVQTSLGVFSSTNLEATDYLIYQCRQRGIRLILPLVDNYQYPFNGKYWYCSENGVSTSSPANAANFYTNTTVINSFKAHISFVLDHVNPYTGIAYKDEPIIMAWETGNELDIGSSTWTSTYQAWTNDIAQYIKVTKGAQQLVFDGSNGLWADTGATTLKTDNLNNAYVDGFSSHPYTTSHEPQYWVSQAAIAHDYGKCFFIGELNWKGTSAWTATEMYTQCENQFDMDGTLFWELIAYNNSWSDGYTMWEPGTDQYMVATQQFIAAHADVMAANEPCIGIMESATSSTGGSTSRSITFSSNWTPKAGQIVVLWCGSGTVTTIDMSFATAWVNCLASISGTNTVISSDAHSGYVLYHVVTSAEETAGTLTYSVNVQNTSGAGNTVGMVLDGVDLNAVVGAVNTGFSSPDTTTYVIPSLPGASVHNDSRIFSQLLSDGGTIFSETPPGWADITYISANTANWVGIKNERGVAGVSVPGANVTAPLNEYIGITIEFNAKMPITGTIAASIKKTSASFTGAMQPRGTVAGTLKRVTASLMGAQRYTGTVSATLKKTSASMTGAMQPRGSVSATLKQVVTSMTGAQRYTGTVSATLKKVTASLAGVEHPKGTVAATLKRVTASLTGEQRYTGTITATLKRVTAAATGAMQPSGTVTATLKKVTASAAGEQAQSGTVSATLKKASALLTGQQTGAGVVSATLKKVSASLTGQQRYTGTVAATLKPVTATATGSQAQTGVVAATLKRVTASATGVMQPKGTLTATLKRVTASATGAQSQRGTISAQVRKVTASLTGAMWATGSISATLKKVTASVSGGLSAPGTVVGNLRRVTASLTGSQTQTGIVAATLKRVTASLTASQTQTGTLAVTLKRVTAALTGTQAQTGSISATLQRVVATATGAQRQSGVVAASVKRVTAALAATQTLTGTIAATLRRVTAAATGGQAQSGVVSASVKRVTAALAGEKRYVGSISASLKRVTASLIAPQSVSGSMAAQVKKVSGFLIGYERPTGSITATLKKVSALLTGLAGSYSLARVLRILAENRTLRIAAEDRTLTVAAEDRTLVVEPETKRALVVTGDDRTTTVSAESRILAVTPEDRSMTVDPEDRVAEVDDEDRAVVVAPEDRTLRIGPEDRTLVIEAEDRTLVVEG